MTYEDDLKDDRQDKTESQSKKTWRPTKCLNMRFFQSLSRLNYKNIIKYNTHTSTEFSSIFKGMKIRDLWPFLIDFYDHLDAKLKMTLQIYNICPTLARSTTVT